jgi:hypothetical protein
MQTFPLELDNALFTTIIPLLIIRLYIIDWMIKGTGYQNGQKIKKINTKKCC